MLMESQYAVCKLHENSTNMMPFVKQVTFNMTEAFAKLDGLSQRVSFATGRVQFVQGKTIRALCKKKWVICINRLLDLTSTKVVSLVKNDVQI